MEAGGAQDAPANLLRDLSRRAEPARRCGDIEEGLIQRKRLDERRVVPRDVEHGFRRLAIRAEVHRHDDCLRAEVQCRTQRHGGMDSKSTRFVRRSADHSAIQLRGAVTCRRATDDDREPAQFRPAQLLDGRIERVEVEVDDRAVGHARALEHVASGARLLPPLVDVGLTNVARANHQFHVRNREMRSRATQHPRRWIVLVLVDALIEVDLIQIAQKSKPVQGNSPLGAPFLDVLLELHAYFQYMPMSRSATGNSRSAAISASAPLAPRTPCLLMSTARIPAACAPAMSVASRSPTMTVRSADVPSARSAASNMRVDGLRHPTSAENVTASRWVSSRRNAT